VVRKSSTRKLRDAAALADANRIVRVAIYVRRSTDDENQPYSIDVQDTRLDAYIASQPNWQLVLRFADDASGASTERKDLQRALAAARAGLYDVLLVYRVDRFSRSLRDTVTLLDELDTAGVTFRSATEPFDTATPMGRMLLQMLAMFAQFERDSIVERVIGGMERKAAKGLWKGGRRPFGYQVDKAAQKLVLDEGEAAIVRTIFDLYIQDRLGAKAIAHVLNDRGHRTTTGRNWSGHQVLRALTNRIHLGELSFRDTTVTDTHPAIITPDVWARAEQILAERGEDYAHRASNSSDYQLTGRLGCPTCARAMIGTRATGRHRTYRYYTCFARARYDSTTCDAPRLDADAVDAAVLDALAHFYRDHTDLITAAVDQHRTAHRAAHSGRTTELAAIDTELTRVTKAIDRNLAAYENDTLDEETLAERLPKLRDTAKQLRRRREQLTVEIDAEPEQPDAATLAEVADHITDIIAGGTDNERKALIETLIERVIIAAPGSLVPVFRIPQTTSAPAQAGAEAQLPTPVPAGTATPEGAVRAMTNSVELRGFEPLTPSMRTRCATRLRYSPEP
jgi:site-specific DNA recombinase